MYFLDYILLVISILLIVIIVLQSPKDDARSAFSGEKSELFANQKQRGMERVISIVTAVLLWRNSLNDIFWGDGLLWAKRK